MKDYLFPNQEYISMYGNFASTDRAAEVIVDGMKTVGPNHEEAMLDAIDGYFDGGPKFDDFKTRGADGKVHYDYESYSAAAEIYSKKMLAELKEKMGDAVDLFVFEFSDNDGDFFCTLEHGGTFESVPHIKISKH